MNCIDQSSTYGRAGVGDKYVLIPKPSSYKGLLIFLFKVVFFFIGSSDCSNPAGTAGGHPDLPFTDKDGGISIIPKPVRDRSENQGFRIPHLVLIPQAHLKNKDL